MGSRNDNPSLALLFMAKSLPGTAPSTMNLSVFLIAHSWF